MIALLRRLYIETAQNAGWDVVLVLALLAAESVLCVLIIARIPYTEIDWEAYMQQVATFEAGERDYMEIKGGTGPLVYPAGFLYLFWVLRYLTDHGSNLRIAQYIFAGFYVATQACVCVLYTQAVRYVRVRDQSSVPPENNAILWNSHAIWSWRVAMAATCLSKRLHSIFLLRLFNDGPTMLFLYISLVIFSLNPSRRISKSFFLNKWSIGCFFFSLAVSLKMNVLLFAPGLLLLLLQASKDFTSVVARLLLFCALPQLVLGAPFLLTHPVSYLRKAFELDRVFFYKWTVNWKFLPENIFLSKPLAIALLIGHVGSLIYMTHRWLDATNRILGKRLFLNRQLSPVYITSTLLLSNYIGICFARTLHYQFYSWYFHALPYLLWYTTVSKRQDRDSQSMYRIGFRLALLLITEVCFLTFPATAFSSAMLQLAHICILLQIRAPEPCLSESHIKSS